MKNFSNIKTQFSILFLALFALTFVACDDDEGVMDDEQELITTVTVRLTPEPQNISLPFSFKDLDGPGGNAPTVDTITLAANQLYSFGVEFFDESDANDVEDITEEVKEEAAEHLVCFEVTGSAIAPTTSDLDANSEPLGLVGTFTTQAAGNGTLTIILKHEPDKGAADPCATGETDVEVTFPVVVE